MVSLLELDQPTIHRLTGEFRDPELERRFRSAVLQDWHGRLKTNAVISTLAYVVFSVVDYHKLGWSPAYETVTALRVAFAAFAAYLLVTTLAPGSVARYDRWSLIFGYALCGSFCAITYVADLDVMSASVAMIAILTQIYQFVPGRPVLTVAAVLPSIAVFFVIILRHQHAATGDVVAVALTLFMFNVAGVASTLRVAKLQRLRFATREAESQILAQLKEQSRELAAARDEANHANRAKSEFLAHMSHELRSPLNAINGFSEIIKDELFGPAPPRYRDYAADIHRSGMLLTALINDILDLSKVEAGKLELHDEIVAPAEAVEACLRLVKDRAFKARLTLRPLIPADAPALRADDRLVKQMLLNLLTNAIKFTPEGGEVRIVGRLLPDGAYALAVEDTGIGIAAEDLARVLEPYGQVEAALSRNQESTGLGLPLVKKMIELHGGHFCLESTPGKGTVASLVVPRDRVTAADSRPSAPLAKAG